MKPILFNTEMVRAILDGRKTVTRRVIDVPQGFRFLGWNMDSGDDIQYGDCTFISDNLMSQIVREPKYNIGDILYVRESFFEHRDNFYFKADYDWIMLKNLGISFKLKPSIHMPQEAARLFLRVTNVRVERLQDITEYQAMQEGVDKISTPNIPGVGETFTQGFGELWNSTIKKSDINKCGWNANPWVFVYEFEVISKDIAMEAENEM